MKIWSVTFASAAFVVSSMAFAQQQYDSLGSPTPAPNQNASPTAANPNVPVPGKAGAASTSMKPETSGSGASSSANTPSTGGVNGTLNTGTSTPTDPASTPSGLTPD